MKDARGGNGSSKIEIEAIDRGGWIIFRPSGAVHVVTDVPHALVWSMQQWFESRPHLRLRSALAISKDGNTVEIHGFYEQVAWPSSSAD
jgi:hypothetical protein